MARKQMVKQGGLRGQSRQAGGEVARAVVSGLSEVAPASVPLASSPVSTFSGWHTVPDVHNHGFDSAGLKRAVKKVADAADGARDVWRVQ